MLMSPLLLANGLNQFNIKIQCRQSSRGDVEHFRCNFITALRWQQLCLVTLFFEGQFAVAVADESKYRCRRQRNVTRSHCYFKRYTDHITAPTWRNSRSHIKKRGKQISIQTNVEILAFIVNTLKRQTLAFIENTFKRQTQSRAYASGCILVHYCQWYGAIFSGAGTNSWQPEKG